MDLINDPDLYICPKNWKLNLHKNQFVNAHKIFFRHKTGKTPNILTVGNKGFFLEILIISHN